MGTTENPEGITNMMCKYLNRKLHREFSQFAGYTNAELCELEGLNEPVWVMRLYEGNATNYAMINFAEVISHVFGHFHG